MLKSKRFNTAATIILTVLVIITLLPLALIVISSFTKESALIRNGYSFWPQEWSLDAYYYMIKQGAVILRSYGISVFVTVVGTAASVILTTMLAYPMSRKSFKYHNALSFFVFFTMLFAVSEAANRLGFEQVSGLISMFIQFGANILLGAVILMIGFWLANLVAKVIGRGEYIQFTLVGQFGTYLNYWFGYCHGFTCHGYCRLHCKSGLWLNFGCCRRCLRLGFWFGWA